jgi:hypothetical protein
MTSGDLEDLYDSIESVAKSKSTFESLNSTVLSDDEICTQFCQGDSQTVNIELSTLADHSLAMSNPMVDMATSQVDRTRITIYNKLKLLCYYKEQSQIASNDLIEWNNQPVEQPQCEISPIRDPGATAKSANKRSTRGEGATAKSANKRSTRGEGATAKSANKRSTRGEGDRAKSAKKRSTRSGRVYQGTECKEDAAGLTVAVAQELSLRDITFYGEHEWYVPE